MSGSMSMWSVWLAGGFILKRSSSWEESRPVLSSMKVTLWQHISACLLICKSGVPDMMLPRDRNGVKGTQSVDSVKSKHVPEKKQMGTGSRRVIVLGQRTLG